MPDLAKVYEPKTIEKEVYSLWIQRGAFNADPAAPGPKYCIVIPPPNVTAALHLGHALNNTLQDVLIRWRRMQQYNTLWMPGTDHAGIATQTVVEKRVLAEQGKRRTDFAREEFVGIIQAWKDQYEQRILDQLKQMGCSCDWRRTRFTMDEMCAKAVRANFFKLFSDGLIYRGKRLVNWDVATQTVLADDEVEYEEIKGHFYYLKYPLVEPATLPGGAGSDAGVSPARDAGILPARDAAVPAASPAGVSPAVDEEQPIAKRQGRYLPHWQKEGSTIAVTFRLGDSIPQDVLRKWSFERQDILKRAEHQKRPLTTDEKAELHQLYSTRIEKYLDAGCGECLLKDPRAAEIVRTALKHFDNQRYELIAWSIMPNHVHAIIKPLGEHLLENILHSWKSFTAKEINKAMGREGNVWMEEYYDHLIRDERDFRNQVDYVLSNPANAGLKAWPWVGHRELDSGDNRGQDARETRGQDGRDTRGRDARVTRGQDVRVTHVTVATTRPETMLGDTAVAMNPRDPQAKFLVGKKVRLPIVGREIPIIADEHVVMPDPDSDDEKARFSTGFLKVTPAHDPDDYAIGQRHNLPVINVMAPDGTISDKHGWTDWEQIKNPDVENFVGMDRFEAREAILEWFRTEGLLEDVKDYVHQVGHSYRSHVPIEPYLSDQWYIAVKKPIANCEPSGRARRGELRIASLQGEPVGANLKDELVEARDGVTFIKGTDVPVNSLAGLALMPLLDGRLKFTPDRYANNYRTWLENLRDWPISRQLWWGHQIPVWRYEFTDEGKNAILDSIFARKPLELPDADKVAAAALAEVVKEYPDEVGVYAFRELPNLGGGVRTPSDEIRADGTRVVSLGSTITTEGAVYAYLRQDNPEIIGTLVDAGFTRDPDVLDTWFSSALWPFSTLGWPDGTPELKRYYPGDVLCTAREIITLWVSRMVMMGQYCVGDIPFTDVFIHAMIQDGQGRKMSKSLGNGIDPLDIIDSHGADAMRFTLVSMTTQTQDVRMPVETMTLPDGRVANTSPKFDVGRNFANKLWNASRFAMMNLAGYPAWSTIRPTENLADAWILSRLSATIREATAALEQFSFNDLASTLYHFMWDDFCDWYLEIAKGRINAGQAVPKAIVAHCLDMLLRLLHPIMPFITEAIWSNLNQLAPARGPGDQAAEPMLIRAHWPQADAAMSNPTAEQRFATLQELIREIRNVRTQHNVPPGQKVDVMIEAPADSAALLNENFDLLKSQANLANVTIHLAAAHLAVDGTSAFAVPSEAAAVTVGAIKGYVLGIIDRGAELERLTKQAAKLQTGIAAIERKLASESFIAKAPPQVVANERKRLEGLQAELAAVQKSLDALK